MVPWMVFWGGEYQVRDGTTTTTYLKFNIHLRIVFSR